ncbi:MAG: citrate lyase acyl carrier protein [Fusobacteriaceae bacterium]|jgi:citrate lyase subunit gamma (acyl carrier protein)|nr:citrate lyase acyl carrier protein [Fusobacteriaceae bacterium]
MLVRKPAIAGTLESSDVQVSVEPSESGLKLTIDSIVMNQYGPQIKQVVTKTLEELDVINAVVRVVDRGALDCTIRARVQCAVFRSCDASHENIPWKGAVR